MKNKSAAVIIMVVAFLFCCITIAYCSEATDKSRISIGLRAKSGDKEGEKYLIERLNRYVEVSIMTKETLGYVGHERERWRFIDSVDKAHNSSIELPLHRVIEELSLCGTNECLKAAIGFFAKFQPMLDSTGCASQYQHGMLEPQPGLRNVRYIDSPRELIIHGLRDIARNYTYYMLNMIV